MVSAPTGRVCKKNAQAVHVTMEIRIVTCYMIAPLSNASSVPLLASVARGLSAASRLLLVIPAAQAHRFIVHSLLLFISFFRTTSLRRRRSASHSGAECDTRHSFVNVQEERRQSCVCGIVSSTESNFHLCV